MFPVLQVYRALQISYKVCIPMKPDTDSNQGMDSIFVKDDSAESMTISAGQSSTLISPTSSSSHASDSEEAWTEDGATSTPGTIPSVILKRLKE